MKVDTKLMSEIEQSALYADNQETMLKIDFAEESISEKGNQGVKLYFKDALDAGKEDTFFWLGIATPDMVQDNPRYARMCQTRLNEFIEAFGVEIVNDELDVDSLKGLQGGAIMGTRETPDYGIQNNIKRFQKSNIDVSTATQSVDDEEDDLPF